MTKEQSNYTPIISISIILILLLLIIYCTKKIGERSRKRDIENTLIILLDVIKLYREKKELPYLKSDLHYVHDCVNRYLKEDLTNTSITPGLIDLFYKKMKNCDQKNYSGEFFRLLIKELVSEQLGFKIDVNGFWLGPGYSSTTFDKYTITKSFLSIFKAKDVLQKGYPSHFFAIFPYYTFTSSFKKSFFNKTDEILRKNTCRKDFGTKGLIMPEVLVIPFEEPISSTIQFDTYFDGFFLMAICFCDKSGKNLCMLNGKKPLKEKELIEYKNVNMYISFVVFKKIEFNK